MSGRLDLHIDKDVEKKLTKLNKLKGEIKTKYAEAETLLSELVGDVHYVNALSRSVGVNKGMIIRLRRKEGMMKIPTLVAVIDKFQKGLKPLVENYNKNRSKK